LHFDEYYTLSTSIDLYRIFYLIKQPKSARRYNYLYHKEPTTNKIQEIFKNLAKLYV